MSRFATEWAFATPPVFGPRNHEDNVDGHRGMSVLHVFASRAPAEVGWAFDVPMDDPRPEPDWGGISRDNSPTNEKQIEAWDRAKDRRRRAIWPWVWAAAVLEEGERFVQRVRADEAHARAKAAADSWERWKRGWVAAGGPELAPESEAHRFALSCYKGDVEDPAEAVQLWREKLHRERFKAQQKVKLIDTGEIGYIVTLQPTDAEVYVNDADGTGTRREMLEYAKLEIVEDAEKGAQS